MISLIKEGKEAEDDIKSAGALLKKLFIIDIALNLNLQGHNIEFYIKRINMETFYYSLIENLFKIITVI